ncbi:MAG: hypothetical protein PF486_03445 [Prolixibacteraceae bacterium]|jgi:2-aminoadipate transaminase|nr:hypothetical protein [Prolixibacteraceae bacterium]
MFVNPGDGVLVEKPTYLGGIQALSAYSPKFYEVDLKVEGPDILQAGNITVNRPAYKQLIAICNIPLSIK